uniref:Uncharacterized protein n=1 Tax=Aquisalinus luteolus TaxID=1566827 RepID=A0A8J3EQH6_9PROT|nr:hypothetical protein GCM10011355_12100 [Aquisalinus luteolus]
MIEPLVEHDRARVFLTGYAGRAQILPRHLGLPGQATGAAHRRGDEVELLPDICAQITMVPDRFASQQALRRHDKVGNSARG